MAKNILAVGAYERDNFGDILFLEILKKILPDDNIVPVSIFYRPPSDYLLTEVLPYEILLNDYEWDAVWIVGGEVGGVDFSSAYSMSLDLKHQQRFKDMSDAKKKYIYQLFSGEYTLKDKGLAYIPNLNDYSKNKKTPLIVNSVGVSNTAVADQVLQDETQDILSSAKYVSVREEKSKEYLETIGVDCHVSPDIVHTVALHDNWFSLDEEEYTQINSGEYALVQINEYLVKEFTVKTFADHLYEALKDTPYSILFFAAGVAVGHDSYGFYEEIKNALKRKSKDNRRIDIINSREPRILLNYIRYSSLWIGTSLHGRILSIAYDIPRVSLSNKKVAAYARQWDEQYPYDVDQKGLASSVREALLLSSVRNRDGEQLAIQLAKQATNNYKRAIKSFKYEG